MGTGCLAARQRGRSRTRGGDGRGWGSGRSSSRGSPACGTHGGQRGADQRTNLSRRGNYPMLPPQPPPRVGHHSAPVHGEYRPCWHPSSRQDRGGPDLTPHAHRPSQKHSCGVLRAASQAFGVQPSRSGAAMLHRPLSDFLPRGTPAALPVGAAAAGQGGQAAPTPMPPPVLQSHRPGLPAQRPVPLARHRRCGRRALPPSLCSALPAAGTSLLAPPPAPAPPWGEACSHAGLSVAGCRQQQSWSKGSASIPLSLAHLSQGRWSGESPVPRAGCWEKGPPAAWDSRKPPKCVWGSGRAGSPRAATELPAPRDLAARVGAELCCLLPAARRRRCWRASGG